MDVHKNARLTVHCRETICKRVMSGVPVRVVAMQFCISERTVRKWIRRYQEQGLAGLQDRSCRPKRSPTATVRERELAVIALRRQRLTLEHIARQLELGRSTVARICARAGLNRLSKLEPVQPIVRFERAEPGELLHFDVKKLGRIQGVGHRITGRGRHTHAQPGWEYAHVAIDDSSRVGYSQIYPNEQAVSAVMFLRAAVAYYTALGVKIREVMTDNGSCYRSGEFKRACRDLGVKHIFTRPYTPRTNGKAERFIQSALREWAYARAYTHSDQRIAALPIWLHRYNWHRPHASLAGQPPISRLGLDRNNLLRLHS